MVIKDEGSIIVIDLGTVYLCVEVSQHDKVEIIANDHGNHMTPPYVAFIDIEHLIDDTFKN
ncbi:unnamed protein product [Musa hybrid cultivar]